jgi:Tfp pilus assembly protein PilF
MQATRIALCLAAALAATLPAHAQDADALTAQARGHLTARDPQAALDTLAKVDSQRGAAAAGFDQLFLQGVSWQELATTLDGVQRDAAIGNARQAYQQALSLRPDSAAVYNNLAALVLLVGGAETGLARAAPYFERAVDVGGARRGYYALNYAQALAAPAPDRALVYARIALDLDPGSAVARRTVGELLVRLPDSAELLRFGARAVNQGHTALATTLALDALRAASPERTPQWRAALLGLVALALTHDPVNLAQAPDAALLDTLDQLAADPDVGAGSRQLGAALRGAVASPAAVSWWNNEPLPGLDRTRRALMRDLLRVLGEQHNRSDVRRAEGWLRAAVELGEHGPDPDAFLRLVELFANADKQPELRRLMERYEYELFTEKGAAYQRNDWRQIYRLHLALGTTYAHLQIWQSPQSPFQNAVFQLENAAKAAERFNADAKRRNLPDRLALPPTATLQLSRAYVAVGKPERAAQVRVDAAQTLLDVQRPADSAELLQTLSMPDMARLTAADKTRVVRLQQLTKP